MVNPVSVGVQQQIPAANTFQPGGTTDAPKRTEQDNKLQTSDDAPVRAKSVETSYEKKEVSASANNRAEDTGGVTASSSRGTELDITV